MTLPILYSFRRCPYAMRARLAIASAGVPCELREIVLRDKAPAFLAASPKGTVPVLVDGDVVIEESLDIMHWALVRHDPEGWLATNGTRLITEIDGPFKTSLDRYKYASRHQTDPATERAKASVFLMKLNDMLASQAYLYADTPTLPDMAIAPFIRQFANTDRTWFDAQPWPHLARWLDAFLTSPRFQAIMTRYDKWEEGVPVTIFPAPQ